MLPSEEASLQETLLTIEVPPGYREGSRLDRYLTRAIENASRTKVQAGIREGRVTVNGTVVDRASYVVQAGDVIACRLLRPPPIEALPEPIPLSVVYEDDYLIVVDKPAGMVMHPAYGNRTGTLVNALLHHVGAGPLRFEPADAEAVDEEAADEEAADAEAADAEATDEEAGEAVGLSTLNAAPVRAGDVSIRPGIVHRLDKDTSGLIVVAKDDVTHRALARLFFHRTIRRRYLALVWGVPDPPAGRIEAPVGRDARDRKRMAVVRPDRGKHAVTHFETVEAFAYTALVSFRLETGRTHQIRVHAQHVAHPVLGDPTYGGQAIVYGPHTARRRAFFQNVFARLGRQALHAHTLGFRHPRTGEELDFAAPLPADLQDVLERLRRGEEGPSEGHRI